MFRRLSVFQLVVDIGFAAACLAVRFTMSVENPAMGAVVVLMAAALALRRISPGLALAVAWVGAILQMLAGMTPDASNLAILAVLYTSARYGTRIVRWLGLASAGLGALVATIYLTSGPGLGLPDSRVLLGAILTFVGSAAVLGLSWTLGLLVLTWRTSIDSRRERGAAQRAVIVEQERNRIARDMHDVVAHSLAVVIAQADGARYASATDPAVAQDALATIATTAREALGDVRSLLAQLRHEQGDGPSPTLADLTALVEQLRASGLSVDVSGPIGANSLPAAQQLALYRIAQEALTNALRHGRPGGRATLSLGVGADAATLTIANTLAEHPRPVGRAGHGITGMTERAHLAGGSLTATAEGDSFVVTARIPVGSRS